MKHETRERNLNISSQALELFTNEQKFGLYQDFKKRYAGDPFTREEPRIELDRGGVNVLYDYRHFSAMSDNNRHLIHIRYGHNTKGIGTEINQQLFVVTADFETFDMTEWWVYKILSNKPHEPKREVLYLSQHPVHEVEPQSLVTQDMDLFEQIVLKNVEEAVQKDRDERAIRYVFENERAALSWGDGQPAEQFRSFFDIEFELEKLRALEIETGQTVSHPSIRAYYEARAA